VRDALAYANCCCLDHDCASCGLCARSDVTMGLWKFLEALQYRSFAGEREEVAYPPAVRCRPSR
jgi:hypothetical protein